MKIKLVGLSDVGEVIDFWFDEDYMVIFKVIWYGRPGTWKIRADMVETI